MTTTKKPAMTIGSDLEWEKQAYGMTKIVSTMKGLKEGYTCAHCNTKLVRIFSAPGVSFKGEGFASNDKK